MTLRLDALTRGRRASLTHPTPQQLSDAEELAVALLNEIRGEVRFDDGSRALYATDASNYRQVPIGVVIPRDADDVVATVALCRERGVPIVSRGGGTSLAGQTCNVAVVMDHSKYNNRLVELNPDERFARVQPGIVLDTLRDAAEKHNLTFGPDPATHTHCTLGGMIGNNSCGVHSVMAGKTDDNVYELDVLTYRGDRFTVGATTDDELDHIIAVGDARAQIYRRMVDLRDKYSDAIRQRFPDIPRRVSGYNVPYLLAEKGFDVAKALVGSESTLVTVLEAKVRLVDSPPGRTLVAVGYKDVFEAADDVPYVIDSGCIACEGMDDKLVRDIAARGIYPEALTLLPDGAGFLLVEFGGKDRAESDASAKAFEAKLHNRLPNVKTKMYDDPADEAKLWRVREAGLGATAMVPGKPTSGPGWEDSSVPPDKLGEYLRRVDKLFRAYGYSPDLYGHFGQGVLHCRVNFDLISAKGLADFRRFMSDAAELVVSMGGSLSGEHGDGQARAELLPIMFGDQLVDAFRAFKSIWDPDGKMNPGKLVDANPILSDLRLGTSYNPRRVKTEFSFPDDHNSFAHATFRCVGVGECRRHDGGTMCPSYMVTREEKHSTRGRAHLLFEMMQGHEIRDGWRSDEVREALDLCLACKGCKGDCPVNVDMATYKAEFLAHYWHHRVRPRQAYAMGLIPWWLRLGRRAPRIANFATGAPGLRSVAKLVAGVAPQRSIPQLAPQTFTDWFSKRAAGRSKGDRVILWPDTFTDHFHPDSAKSALAVLEAAGFTVELPRGWVCCGRPMYDWGLISQGKQLLRQSLRVLRPALLNGTPIIGLEPSCVAAFRDELPQLFPNSEDAVRLSSQTYLLTEFLHDRVPEWQPPSITGKALVHGHCHQKAVLGMDAQFDVLRSAGLELDVPDSGCCGMAGAFGFEKGEKYEVSIAAGERVLLPAVREAADDTLIVAAGFSCREQIEQMTNRRALHPADVLAQALSHTAH
jgi:FAD/FMN-containing dehydrogenase/Fe-S oxidoreductase